MHAVRPSTDLDRRRVVLRMARIHSKFQTARYGPNFRGNFADDRAGASGLATRHQNAWHQWRRLFQSKFVSSLRKSHSLIESRADAADLLSRRRPDLYIREDGAGYAAGLGDFRDDERAFPGRRLHLLLGGTKRKSNHSQIRSRDC